MKFSNTKRAALRRSKLKQLLELYHELEISIYVPRVSTQRISMDFESALCFKIDGDLSFKKTGKLETRLKFYLDDAQEPQTPVYLATLYKELVMLVERSHKLNRKRQTAPEEAIRDQLRQATGE